VEKKKKKEGGGTGMAGTLNLWGAVEVLVCFGPPTERACKKSSSVSKRRNNKGPRRNYH